MARRRRFPKLLLITGGLLIVDLIVPDLVPFVDEILLGLMTVILAGERIARQDPVADGYASLAEWASVDLNHPA